MGVEDVELARLSPAKTLLHALANQSTDSEGGYAVRHSMQALRDIGPLHEHQHRHSEDTAVPTVSMRDEKPEYLIATSYPTLFPYGLGMVEDHQPGALSFVQQCCRLLKYHHRCF